MTARIDFHENGNSQWFGRFSWMDETGLSQGLKLNGGTLITRPQQYMVSNTRVLGLKYLWPPADYAASRKPAIWPI